MNLEVIKAAGAVLWRDVDGEAFEIAVVHRPRYDDWSLPKGKLERGEAPITAARREVFEETGFISDFGPSLGTISYTNDDALKEVYYWIAKAHPKPTGELPVAEVDQLEWLSPQDAIRKVTNESDRDFLNKPQIKKIITQIDKGLSIRNIAKITDVSPMLVQKTKKVLNKKRALK